MIKRLKRYITRRFVGLVVLFALLVAGEAVPNRVFAELTRYDMTTHPLGLAYNSAIRNLNVAVFILIVLSVFPKLQRFFFWTLAGTFLFETVSAAWLLVDRATHMSFHLSMFHMVGGKIFLPLFIAYLFNHLFKWINVAGLKEIFVGFFALLFAGTLVWIGALFSILGGPESVPLAKLHGYGSLAIPLVLWWHLAVSSRRKDSARRREALALGGYVYGRREIAYSLILTAALFLGAVAMMNEWVVVPERVSKAVPLLESVIGREPVYIAPDSGYSKPFGDGLFLPAKTKTAADRFMEPMQFQQAKACGYDGCHVDILEHWEESGHRHSFNPVVRKVMGLLEEERGVEARRYCAGCHNPIDLLTGAVDRGGAPLDPEQNEGVTCNVCHGITAVGETASNSDYTVDLTPYFFRRNVTFNRYLYIVAFLDAHKKEFNKPFYKTPNYCATCHRHFQPPEINKLGIKLADKMGEWEEGVHSKETGPKGIQVCNDCHMPKFLEQYQMKMVKGHRFLSSNTGLPTLYGHKNQLELTQKQLRSGVIELKAEVAGPDAGKKRYAPGDVVAIDVSLYNGGVGHGFPAGAHDLTQAWLQVEAVDARGREFWSAGAPGPDGELPADAFVYGSDLLDAEGNPILRHEVWSVAGVKRVHRLMSGQKEETSFDFTIPPKAEGPLKVRVRLRHRRYNPTFARWVFDGDLSRSVITDMQEKSLIVQFVKPL